MSARVAQWITDWNARIIPFEQRPDRDQWAGEEVFRIRDAWTTINGSWEADGREGALPPWARDAYLSPDFHTAGGDHHVFAAVKNQAGELMPKFLVYFWSGGAGKLALPADQFRSHLEENGATRRTDPTARFADIPIYASSGFDPNAGERGTFCWAPMGPADVFEGGGMPWNWHVSWFVVWQAEPRTAAPPVDPPSGGDIAIVRTEIKAVHTDLKALARHLGLPLT